MKNAGIRRGMHPFGVRALTNGENTSSAPRSRATSAGPNVLPEKDKDSIISPSKTTIAVTVTTPRTPTKKAPISRKSSSVSPVTSRKKVENASPKSAAA
jgi:hypothetical protein